MKRTTKKRIIKTFTCYIPVAVVTIIMLFPFYWFLNTSLKEQGLSLIHISGNTSRKTDGRIFTKNIELHYFHWSMRACHCPGNTVFL